MTASVLILLAGVVHAQGPGNTISSAPSGSIELQQAQPPNPAPAVSKAPALPPDKFSGQMFGDYYYFKSDNVPAFDTQQGFWFRRIFFTYDHFISQELSMRFRLEANSGGKMTTPTGAINPYIKDASLKWAYHGKHQATFGIQSTGTFEVVEGVYGLRHIEKTPGDLYKIDTTRDFGVSFSGPLNAGNTLQYMTQFGNDSSSNSETDKYKAVRLSLRYVTNPGFTAEAFYSYHYRPLMANRTIAQLFVGYQNPQARVGLQYMHHNRQPNEGTANPDTTINIVSGFGVWTVKPNKFGVFGRVDRSDANPDGAGLDYLPLYKSAPFTFGVMGVEFFLHPTVRVSPNVEWVTYGTPVAGAAAPLKNDTVMRVTCFWIW